MTTGQTHPMALKLADAIELRRLQAENEALREALQEIVDAADGSGWDQLDAGFTKARAALQGEKE